MNIEKEKRKIHTGSIVLMVIALVMIIISIRSGMLPPGLTGAGFLILVWIIEENKAIADQMVRKVSTIDPKKEPKDKK